MKRAIVLAGGGSKGSYQIGFFKAIKKLGIKYHIVTGTSVGALNGVLFVQDDLKKGMKLWNNMNFDIVFDKKIVDEFNNLKTTKDMIMMFSSNYFKNKGMDTSTLENTIKPIVNYKKFFKSKIDFGITTYNLSKNIPVKITKSELNKDNLLDYVLASSSCYPAFQKRKIKNDYYIDGGIFDTVPINLAIDMGADEVIAVDLKAPGIRERVKNKNIPITYIEPSNELANFLDFSNMNAKIGIKMGYFDTMKVYGKLDGYKYTFKKDHLDKNFKKYGVKFIDNLNMVFDYVENKKTIDELIKMASFKRITSLKKNNKETFDEIVEYIGRTFDIDLYKCYKIRKYNKILLRKLRKLEEADNVNTKLKVTDILNKQKIIKYFYVSLCRCENDYSLKKDIVKLAFTFPKEFLSSLYLYTIRKGFWLW